MLSLTLNVETPTEGWCHRVGRRWPDLDVRVVSCFPLDTGVLLEVVELNGPRWKEALEDLRTYGTVEGTEVLEETPAGATVRLRARGCPFARVFATTGVLPTFPFSVKDSRDRWDVVLRPEEVRGFVAAAVATGRKATVVRSGAHDPPRDLTDRQRVVLEAGVREGYYDYPRRITLTQLAEKLGIAKSTLSETLMMVERQIVGNRVRSGEPSLR